LCKHSPGRNGSSAEHDKKPAPIPHGGTAVLDGHYAPCIDSAAIAIHDARWSA
jgi:hypothetical protein